MRLGALVRIGLIYFIMGMPQRRDLRQVGDRNDLAVGRHLFHDCRHLRRDITTHTGVYLIEDDRRQAFRAGDKCFDAQHQPAYLTARSHFTHVAQALVEVRGQEYLYFVAAARRKVRGGQDRDLHFGMCHTQARQAVHESLAYLRHDGLAALGQRLCRFGERCALGGHRFLCLCDIEIKTVQAVDLFRQLVPQCDQLLDLLRAELMQQAVQVVHPLFDPHQALRIHLDAVRQPLRFLSDILQLDTGALEAFL